MQHFLHKQVDHTQELIEYLEQRARKLDSMSGLKPLMERVGNARIVMLGEASHGTHEYYTWRAFISKKLVEEKGFNIIAVEGDWPDCYRLNRYIKGYEPDSETAYSILHVFNRWPTWMWANWEIVAFAEWLHQFNASMPLRERIGFFGLDVYSLWESMENLMGYLKKTDRVAYSMAVDAFNCFEQYGKEEGRSYAAASRLVPVLCQDEVVHLLSEIQKRMPAYNTDPENVFSAVQNARIAVNAEKYYRTMIQGGPHSWNIRDRHMADTLEQLLDFYGPQSKVIVWEHNTHIGDARATGMAAQGMYNLGELARVEHRDKGVILVGFGTYKGSVIAGNHWGATMTEMEVPEARYGSWEYLLHCSGAQNKLLLMDDLLANDVLMENYIGHRAIGVVYNKSQEHYGNYVPSILPLRYDAFIYLEETSALHPLHIEPDGSQVPETYPFGV